jgi:hypothetical protein
MVGGQHLSLDCVRESLARTGEYQLFQELVLPPDRIRGIFFVIPVSADPLRVNAVFGLESNTHCCAISSGTQRVQAQIYRPCIPNRASTLAGRNLRRYQSP